MRRKGIIFVLAATALVVALAACKDGSAPAKVCKSPAQIDPNSLNQPPAVSGEPVETGSGLKYTDIKPGSGDSPEPTETVIVHYTLWLEDGTKIASSRDEASPFIFIIGQGAVIRGWDEGVATMQVCGQRRLIIPPELAYGPEGQPPVIPPNATLTFDVELLEIR